MHDDQIKNTFAVIRTLPPEIDFSRVRELVLSQPLSIFPGNNSSLINLKNIIIMTTTTAIVSALLMFNQQASGPSAKGQPDQKKMSATEVEAAPAENVPAPHQPGTSVILPVVEIKKADAKMEKEHTETVPVEDAEPGVAEPVWPEPVVTASATVPLQETVVAVAPEEEKAVFPDCNPHHRFPCHCRCNDGNDVTCTFRDKLRDDEIIDDGDSFSFLIDDKQFVVNGKEQPANVYKKYSRIFSELTDEKLTEGTYMKVKMEKGNCSISINYNDSDD